MGTKYNLLELIYPDLILRIIIGTKYNRIVNQCLKIAQCFCILYSEYKGGTAMSAFGKPTPRLVPKATVDDPVTELPSINRDSFHSVAVAHLAAGGPNVFAIQNYTGLTSDDIQDVLASEEYQNYYHTLSGNPEKVLPSRSQVYAQLRVQSTHADTSANKQKALLELLKYIPEGREDGILRKYTFGG
jgi:hypothetical protein